jgi:hypothetical protein
MIRGLDRYLPLHGSYYYVLAKIVNLRVEGVVI